MIQISDTQVFSKIVSDAVEAAISNARTDDAARRWQNAINRAVSEIESNPFLHWEADKQSLLICSPSNNIYSANGVCQCIAFVEFNQPCWHRACARLVRLYFEALNLPPVAKAAVAAPTAKALVIPAPSELTYLPNCDRKVEKLGNIRI